MAANESRARLIKEAGLMQEKGEAGETLKKKEEEQEEKKMQHMLGRNQNNRNK